jgi:hypothetical protein
MCVKECFGDEEEQRTNGGGKLYFSGALPVAVQTHWWTYGEIGSCVDSREPFRGEEEFLVKNVLAVTVLSGSRWGAVGTW